MRAQKVGRNARYLIRAQIKLVKSLRKALGHLAKVVPPHVQYGQRLQPLERPTGVLDDVAVELKIGELCHPLEGVRLDLGDLVVAQTEHLDGLGQVGRDAAELVVIQVEAFQFPQLAEHVLSDLVRVEAVLKQHQPDQVGGVVEHALLDARDLVPLQVDVLDVRGDVGHVVQLATVAVHGGGEIGGTVALQGTVLVQAVGPEGLRMAPAAP